ncbi:MAG: MerR family transcriptional regulator [Ardenticatenaceae bacterium]|nr:MerR family transcriptional regulator [Ardenticatenaceae bacterium]
MFKIGEFARVAQVSGRLLRYYDEIGLFKPAHVDRFTGYRTYSADQLPQLNRILALKELGLSLDQIQRFITDQVSADEIRGMLLMRKSQIEQTLTDELARLRRVEVHLQQIEQEGVLNSCDVLIKTVPPQPVLTYHGRDAVINDMYDLYDLMMGHFLAGGHRERLGKPVFLIHQEHLNRETFDLETGFTLKKPQRDADLVLSEKYTLKPNLWPAVEMMATVVHTGFNDMGVSYNALGRWIEKNHYQMDGPIREFMIEVDYPENGENTVVEIQVPVKPIAGGLLGF